MNLERRATRRSTSERSAAEVGVVTLSEVNANLAPKDVVLNGGGGAVDNGVHEGIIGGNDENGRVVKQDLNGEDDGGPEVKIGKFEDEVELDDEQSNQSSVQSGQSASEKKMKIMHQCLECNKRFYKKGVLTKHMKTHNQPRAFVCDHEDCDKSFVSKRGLEKHVKSIHEGEDTGLHLCQFCQKGFITRSEMDTHAETHLADYKMYACRCGKTFTKKFAMKIAIQASQDQKPDPCPYCGRMINVKQYKDN